MKRRMVISVFWIVLGTVLIGLQLAGQVESFWSGMGAGLMVVGILNLLRQLRYRTDGDYRDKVDVEAKDERNRYLANKAWAWAGYLFVLTAAVGTIAFKLAGKEELMMLASGGVCLMLVFYWGSYMILRRKY